MSGRFVIALALSALLCGAAAGQGRKSPADDENSGIVYGLGYAFTLTAPDGWVLDNTSGKGQGLDAVFYPKGSTWKDSPVVMYANVVGKGGAGETTERVIEGDIAEFRRHSPGLQVADMESPAVAGRTVALKRFAGDENHNHEAVAYIGESKVVVMLVLSAKTVKGFDDALPAFRRLVSSYHFLGDKVIAK